MNYRIIINITAKILCVEALFMLPAAIISLFYSEGSVALSFAISMAVMLAIGLPLAVKKPERRAFYAKEGFVTVGIVWIAVSIFGALPAFISGAIPSYVDSFFEAVSGFSATGASILTDINNLPRGILYWRSFSHWLGGMGILLFLLAMGPLSKDTGESMYLLKAEVTGPRVGKLVPRIHGTAKILYGIYLALTLSQIILMIIGGTPLFDAVAISFGTAGTGGFAVRGDSLASYPVFAQNVTAVFMVLCGINFNIYYLLIMREAKSAFKNEELRVYLVIIAVSAIVIALNIMKLFGSFGESLHHAVFQVAAIISTTGFYTVDYNLWPEFSKTLMVLLMVIGSCAGSTGGGMKVMRVMIIVKSARRAIYRALRPNSVKLMHIDGGIVEEDTVSMAHGYLMLYVLIVAVTTVIISIDGFNLETNFTAALACINNIGFGFGGVGAVENYSDYSALSKIVLSVNMLAGRLEIFPIMALFTPSVWRK